MRIPWVIIKAMLPNTRSLLPKKTHKIKLKKYFSTTWINKNKNIWGGAHIHSNHGAMVSQRRNENSFWESCKQWILIFSISFSSSQKKSYISMYIYTRKSQWSDFFNCEITFNFLLLFLQMNECVWISRAKAESFEQIKKSEEE